MHVYILGIGGTFMAGVALLARAAGHRVGGCDQGLYPPMSTQLARAGIQVDEGYHPAWVPDDVDQIIIGNALSRGNPVVERVLDAGMAYTSGPQWLAEQVLAPRHVMAVAGTHGKTSTASMLAWILEDMGLEPGFLIGGLPANFGVSARLGGGRLFVVEADEYDTAFFDKRSKFLHYRPTTLVLNNIEFDHADIFSGIEDIRRQFHYLLRTVPASGRVLYNAGDANIDAVLAQGCWSEREALGGADGWQAHAGEDPPGGFDVGYRGQAQGRVDWDFLGEHNRMNALAAIAAASHAGVPPGCACAALGRFTGVARRMELRGEAAGVRVYDDFAHHPTAIATTLAGMRAVRTPGRVIAVLEPRSNTMRLGCHRETLAAALIDADLAFVYRDAGLAWDLEAALAPLGERARVFDAIDSLVTAVTLAVRPQDRVVVMSNGAFGGVHTRLLDRLQANPA